MMYLTILAVAVTQTSPTLCSPMDCSSPGFLVLCHLSEFDQTHVCWNDRAIQPSHPLSSPSSPAFKLSQHQGLFDESTLLAEAEYIKKRWQEYTKKLYKKKNKKRNDLSIVPCAKSMETGIYKFCSDYATVTHWDWEGRLLLLMWGI